MTVQFPVSAAETKAGTADIASAFEDFSRTFESFKDVNDQRLAELEHRMSADVLTDEKLSRIDEALDRQQRRLDGLSIKARRPALGIEPRLIGDQDHKTAFAAYMRSGTAEGLKAFEAKAYSAGSGPDGGFLVPQPAERDILSRMALISPFRTAAEIREVSTATFKKAYAINGPAVGWVGEAAARPETGSQTLADLTFSTGEVYAMPSATQTLLDDAAVDIDAFIASEIETIFAEAESEAFITGDGTAKPRGILNYPTVANATWSWGNLGYLVTGAAGAFGAAAPSDILFDLVYALKAGYRQNGSFLMNRKVQSAIRKFKDTAGNYLWMPPVAPGQSATLMNFPVLDIEQMPDIAANSLSVAFGDLRRAYLIVDRQGIRILRDPYTAKPYVRFYTTKRVGGGVQDFEAIKLLKFGTV